MQALNGSPIMFRRVYEITTQQRLAFGAALIAAVLLILVGHAPVIPVIAGCALAVGVSILRSRSRIRKQTPLRRQQ